MQKITRELLRDEVVRAERRHIPFESLWVQLCVLYDMRIFNTSESIKEFEKNYEVYCLTKAAQKNRYSTAC